MSNLSVNAITNAAGGNTATINGMTPTAQSLQGFRNRLINSGMVIDQRNAGASVTQTTSAAYPVDRFYVFGSVTSKFTAQQNAGSLTPPNGFRNYLGATSSSAYTVGSGEVYVIAQKVEGFNFADLMWGTAGAQPVTLSFWVRSSLTGTFGGSLTNSAGNRSYPFSYSVASSNTWEQKTVTIAGDTTGTWLTTNGSGVELYFSLGAGSTLSGTANAWSGSALYSATGATSVVGTNGATFYITGVQLEAGSVATPFERRPYGTELALCQRYFVNSTRVAAISNINTQHVSTTSRVNPVPMRAAPTLSVSGTYTFNPFFGSGTYTSSNTPTLQSSVPDNFIINFNMGSSTGTMGFGDISNATISLSAEL